MAKILSLEKRLAVIRRVQEETALPEGFNLNKVIGEGVGKHWQSRHLVMVSLSELLNTAHTEESKDDRQALRSQMREHRDKEKHVEQCPKCREILIEFIRKLQKLCVQPNSSPEEGREI